MLLLCMGLTACSLPRGAALQSEVIAAQTDETGADISDFAVFAVTRETVGFLDDWPAIGPRGYDWIPRADQPTSLIIAPGDMVRITVWDADENSLLAGPGQRAAQLQPMRVSSSGTVFLPFVGEMRIAGMSPQGARERIEERYIETTPSAQIQLDVEPGRANTANLVSGVASPGAYPLEGRDVTVLELISMGGGVSGNLVNPQIRLIRGDAIYGTSISRLYDNPRLDTVLRGGDRVIVEEEERYFLSLGAAGQESRHVFPADHVTALDAMAQIGGLTDSRADPQGILILRDYPRSAVGTAPQAPPKDRMVFVIDLTSADGLFSAGEFQIMSGDLVYVTESPLIVGQSVLGLVNTLLNLGN